MSTAKSYEEIMGITSHGSSATAASGTFGANEKSVTVQALTRRLVAFRQWLQNDARATVHPAICIVNGEATDGTKNAPVLILDQQQSDKVSNMAAAGSNFMASSSSIGADAFQSSNFNGPAGMNTSMSNPSNTNLKKANSIYEGRVGMIDTDIANTVLYDKTMGCQIRTVKELKKDEVMMTLPRTSMITPDLVAASDAGKALWACCKSTGGLSTSSASSKGSSMWDVLENTTLSESSFLKKVVRNSGPQTLVKILQERKRAEMAFKKRLEDGPPEGASAIELAEPGTISTRAPFLLFLIHQRFFHSERVPVASSTFMDVAEDSSNSSVFHSNTYRHIEVPPNAPSTFSPYARTLPSSVSIPLCWKRNEIAMLAGCIPGVSILQDVAAHTMQLASEFITLIHAGILERFPNTFPPGLLTWDRYVWAAAVFSSRNLPATSYYNKGDVDAFSFRPSNPLEFQSPPEIWDEVGVLIPLLDMLNHEVEDHQITWEPGRNAQTNGVDDSIDTKRPEGSHPRAVVHKKVKKGSEVFCCYGHNISNGNLILQYGFAQINNTSDEVRLGWAISDAVGNVDPPADFKPPYTNHRDYVYESTHESAINAWWTTERIALLEREICASSTDVSFITNLKSRKKMVATAYADGSYYPLLLSAIVVATLPTSEVAKFQPLLTAPVGEKDRNGRIPIVISKRHQNVIQRYLQFSFVRKLEKLLQNLDAGLKGHFPNVKLWTKSSSGGLNYVARPLGESMNGNSNGDFIGWQSFFDSNAYKATMEVEDGYYAMGTASCVLALYDGQLRALQTSLDGVTDSSKFNSGVLKQLEDLGFQISWDGDDIEEPEFDTKVNGITVDLKNHGDSEGLTNQNEAEKEHDSPRNRKRNNKKKTISVSGSATSDEKTPAVKLHVGNLAFTTTPADLYEYFSSIYGQDNVLECHIPIERETGRSRGFGFVAMPEEIALGALQSDRKHEVDGRVLKVARSNSVGAVSNIKPPAAPPPVNSERCLTCGYRPKYCVCSKPNVPALNSRPAAPPSRPYAPPINASSRVDPVLDHGYGPPDYHREDDYRRRHHYHDDGGRYRDYDQDSRYRRHPHQDGDEYRRRYDRDDDYYNRDRDRDRRDRSPPRDDRTHGSRGSSRRWGDYDDRERSSSSYRRDDFEDDLSDDDYDRGRKRSRSKEKSSRRKKGKRRHRSRSSGSSDSRS